MAWWVPMDEDEYRRQHDRAREKAVEPVPRRIQRGDWLLRGRVHEDPEREEADEQAAGRAAEPSPADVGGALVVVVGQLGGQRRASVFRSR